MTNNIEYYKAEADLVEWVKANPEKAAEVTAHFLTVMWDANIVRLYHKLAQDIAQCPVTELNRG